MAKERVEAGSQGDPRGGNGNGGKDTVMVPEPSQALIEKWRKAPIEVVEYPKGIAKLQDGTSYEYREGRRLLITVNGVKHQVMDTCEYPWAAATVNKAFDEMKTLEEHPTIHVVEFGFGLGITANRVLEQLEGRGLKGKYTGVELNEEVFKKLALPWKKRKLAEFERKDKAQPGSRPNIEIELIHGEAGEVTGRLLEEILGGLRSKVHIIFGDTYPMEERQQGVNDLIYLPTQSAMLAQGGVHAIYPYSPEWTPQPDFEKQLTAVQKDLIRPYYGDVVTDLTDVEENPVNPPPEYEYLFNREFGPVRQLPIAICRFPKTLPKAA